MGAAYQVYGSHTLAANLTVAENGSFVIPDGAALTIPDGIILENTVRCVSMKGFSDRNRRFDRERKIPDRCK